MSSSTLEEKWPNHQHTSIQLNQDHPLLKAMIFFSKQSTSKLFTYKEKNVEIIFVKLLRYSYTFLITRLLIEHRFSYMLYVLFAEVYDSWLGYQILLAHITDPHQILPNHEAWVSLHFDFELFIYCLHARLNKEILKLKVVWPSKIL